MSQGFKTKKLREFVFFLTEVSINQLTVFDEIDFLNEIIWQLFHTSNQQTFFQEHRQKNRITKELLSGSIPCLFQSNHFVIV